VGKLVPSQKNHGLLWEQAWLQTYSCLLWTCHSRSAAIQGYALFINKMFELRSYPIRANLADKDNMMSKIIHGCECEENIARHQSPLTREMYVEMARHAKASSCSIDAVLFNFFNLIRVGSFRVAEFAQKTQTKVDEFEYASGNKVVKAFIAIDWNFYDAKGHLMTLHNPDGLAETPKKLRITFRIQRNRKNG
jgi:hypothetical protein